MSDFDEDENKHFDENENKYFDEDEGEISFGSLNHNTKLSSIFNMNAEILFKIESINSSLMSLSMNQKNANVNVPEMQQCLLLQNIERILIQNMENLKRNNFDDKEKFDERDKFKSRSLEFDQDAMKLTAEISRMSAQIGSLNSEIARLKKSESDFKSQLIKSTNNADKLISENLELQTQFDICVAELKIERHLKNSIDAKMNVNKEEISELRLSLEEFQKQNDERKRKSDSDRLMLQLKYDAEIEEINRLHALELKEIREKLKMTKSRLDETQNELENQQKASLDNELQIKQEQALFNSEQKYSRQINELTDEKISLERQLEESKKSISELKGIITRFEIEAIETKERLEDLGLFKRKFERLQSQNLLKKERFQTRIKELLEADPDPSLIGEEVFISLY